MKKLEDYEWICPEPFASVNTTAAGHFRPCCVITGYEKEYPHTIENSSYSEFYRSEFMEKFKEAIKNNDRDFLSPYCKVCIQQENSGNRSARQLYLSRLNGVHKDYKSKVEEIIHTNKEPDFFYSIELDALGGNYCNLSCNMCRDKTSSALRLEKIKLKEEISQPIRIVNGKISPLIKATQSEKFANELPSIVNRAREIKFVGGEPLLTKEIYDVMSMCENKKDTTLRIITNGTQDPLKFISHAIGFKKVSVNISIEGIKEVNDYIRYPSVWKDIMRTYTLMKAAKFEVTLVTTISALNIGRLHELSSLFKPKEYVYGSYVGNNFYSVNSIPNDIKKIYLDRLTKYKDRWQVQLLINCLNNSKFNETDMINMLQHIKRRDNLRGTCLLSIHPEWETYYNGVTV